MGLPPTKGGRFTWTGRGTLTSFVHECGPSHYIWARKEKRSRVKAFEPA
jgi:hypothetical protein